MGSDPLCRPGDESEKDTVSESDLLAGDSYPPSYKAGCPSSGCSDPRIPQKAGSEAACPSLRAFCEGWESTNLNRQADGFSHPKTLSFSNQIFPIPIHF